MPKLLFLLWLAAAYGWAGALLRTADVILSRRAGRVPLTLGELWPRALAWAASTLLAAFVVLYCTADFAYGPPRPTTAADVLAGIATFAAVHALCSAGAACALHRGGRVPETAVAAPVAAVLLLAGGWGGLAGTAVAWDALFPVAFDGTIEVIGAPAAN